jgi:hypothetical protein
MVLERQWFHLFFLMVFIRNKLELPCSTILLNFSTDVNDENWIYFILIDRERESTVISDTRISTLS